MTWRKLGRVFAPSGELAWARSHTHLPTADLRGDRIRVYFAALDEHRYGRVGHVDVAADDPTRVVEVSSRTVLDLGPLGAFDDSGVTPSCVVEADGERRLYYIGWQRAERVPYMLFTGVATECADGTFRRVRRVPVLDRTDAEPYSRSAPFVLRDGPTWRMWYWSCREWTTDESGLHYNNVIRYAESRDGIDWVAHPDVLIAPEGADYSIGRPWVVRSDAGYRMWYSIRSRGEPYRIGYAESPDGLAWTRLDDRAGIVRSADGWDSAMVCYPCVLDVGDVRYLFYNGNGHGATGFGVARWDAGGA